MNGKWREPEAQTQDSNPHQYTASAGPSENPDHHGDCAQTARAKRQNRVQPHDRRNAGEKDACEDDLPTILDDPKPPEPNAQDREESNSGAQTGENVETPSRTVSQGWVSAGPALALKRLDRDQFVGFEEGQRPAVP